MEITSMKIFKIGLRIWIAAISVVSFLIGWIMFAHSGKPVSIFGSSSQPLPVQASQFQPIPTIPPLNDPQLNTQTFQSLPQQQPQMSFQPRLRTGGS
jgi:hypothetical protein